MAQKLKDIVIKTGEYTDREGNTKGRWQNVGALMQSDDGNDFIILERWFNPAGLPNPDNRPNVILSLFASRSQNGNDRAQGGNANDGQRAAVAEQDFEEDFPFITRDGVK